MIWKLICWLKAVVSLNAEFFLPGTEQMMKGCAAEAELSRYSGKRETGSEQMSKMV